MPFHSNNSYANATQCCIIVWFSTVSYNAEHCLYCYFHVRFVIIIIIIIIICLVLSPALLFFCIHFLPSSFLLNSLHVFPSSLFTFSFLPFLFISFFVSFCHHFSFLSSPQSLSPYSCVSPDVYLFPSMFHCSASSYLFLVLIFFLSYFLSFSSKFFSTCFDSYNLFIQGIFRRCSTLLYQLGLSLPKLNVLCSVLCRNGCSYIQVY